jgi:restriction endonuclease Mrr
MSAMPEIPDYQTLMLPLLRIAADGETTIAKAAKRLAYQFALTPEQRTRRVRGGRYPMIHHRAHWAQRTMAKAGLVELAQRGVFRATERGRRLFAQDPERIDLRMPAAPAAGTSTSRFTKVAEEYVRAIRKPTALVDGARLARQSNKHGVGVGGRSLQCDR